MLQNGKGSRYGIYRSLYGRLPSARGLPCGAGVRGSNLASVCGM